jgi:release factor glutamine methyltransferase
VFVPRPETEVLVEIGLRAVSAIDRPIVVDVGTGTGAVALAIADEHPGARVFATDIASEAVALARTNATRLHLDVTVDQGDLFAAVPPELRGRIDLVCANPPYVPPARRDSLPRDVLADPDEAVFGDPDLYRRFFDEARSRVRTGGTVAVEIDDDAAGAVRTFAEEAGFADVRVHTDLNGRERVVSGRRP